MNKLVNLIPAISLAVTMLASQPIAASAETPHGRQEHRVVGTIDGAGTSNMTDLVAAGLKGATVFGLEATLFSDGSAVGFVDCVDMPGDPPGYPGIIFGPITSWSKSADGTVSLHGTGRVVAFPSGDDLGVVPFTLAIQRFGGAGVGHWTMDTPGQKSPFNGGPICQELMASGQLVARFNEGE